MRFLVGDQAWLLGDLEVSFSRQGTSMRVPCKPRRSHPEGLAVQADRNVVAAHDQERRAANARQMITGQVGTAAP